MNTRIAVIGAPNSGRTSLARLLSNTYDYKLMPNIESEIFTKYFSDDLTTHKEPATINTLIELHLDKYAEFLDQKWKFEIYREFPTECIVDGCPIDSIAERILYTTFNNEDDYYDIIEKTTVTMQEHFSCCIFTPSSIPITSNSQYRTITENERRKLDLIYKGLIQTGVAGKIPVCFVRGDDLPERLNFSRKFLDMVGIKQVIKNT